MEGIRRSGRTRQPRRYTTDAFEGLNLIDPDSDEHAALSDHDHEGAEDADFDVEQFSQLSGLEKDDSLSVEEGSDLNASEEEISGGPIEEPDDESVIGSDIVEISQVQLQRLSDARSVYTSKLRKDKACLIKAPRPIIDLHSRSIIDLVHNAGKQVRIAYTYGYSQVDILKGLQIRDQWRSERTLPSKKRDAGGCGGLSYSAFYTQEMQEKEASEGWEWYHESGGREAFARKQNTQYIDALQAKIYVPLVASKSGYVLLGPYRCRELYKLDTGSVLPLDDVWTRNLPREQGTNQSKAPKLLRREGFLLTLGSRIRNLEWIPNQPGHIQYLAVTVSQNQQKLTPNFKAPAFTAVPSFPISIQIWAFHIPSESSSPETNVKLPPYLALVICADWGDIKQIKWCPMQERRSEGDNNSNIRLGLLACVCGDGKLRIVDVECSRSPPPSTQYLVIGKAAFEACPPGTICTSLAWISSNTIAAGCANGCVAIWNLHSALQRPSLLPENPPPFFYQALHQTYINFITSCWPSRPHMLISYSMDGYHRLVDLRSPVIDTVLSPRVRAPSNSNAWHEGAQAIFATDDIFIVKAYNLRRFHQSISVGRMHAPILSLATSICHPFLLMGSADGLVAATNPMPRVVETRGHLYSYQQTWFKHEWRRGVLEVNTGQDNGKDNSLNTSANLRISGRGSNQTHTQAALTPNALSEPSASRVEVGQGGIPREELLQKPLIRMTEGYKLEQRAIMGVDRSLRNEDIGTVISTIHEEETAITAVCWNQNLRYAGWAAAGTASGLLRVENLAMDVSSR